MANQKLKLMKRQQDKKNKQEQARKNQDLDDRMKVWAKLKGQMYQKDSQSASKLLFPYQSYEEPDPKLIPLSTRN